MKGEGTLEKEVAALSGLSREELIERWFKAHGCAPPSGVRRELLLRSAAWHLQARRLGGFSSVTRRRLRKAVQQIEDEIGRRAANRSDDHSTIVAAASMQRSVEFDRSGKTRRTLFPGARLLREWNGRTHVVDVIEGGFVFEGRVFGSLSAIARCITGVQWSGPRFFGL